MVRDDLLSVQVLRAIAALAVCAVHFSDMNLMLTGHSGEPIPLYPLAAGVDLFFVISGFIMVYSSERLFGRPGARSEFWVRRIARIAPLYWVATVVAIWAMDRPYDAVSLIKSYLFIPYFGPNDSLQPLYGVGWTLNYEMFFYALFGVAIMLRRQLAVAVVTIALAGAIAIGRIWPSSNALLIVWTDPIVIEFAFGMAIAMAYRHGVRFPRWLGGLLCLGGAIAVWHGVPRSPPSGVRWLECGVPVALIFAGLALQPPLKFPLSRWMAALGDASYSMYLIHSLVIAAIIRVPHLGHFAPLALPVTVALSLLVYRLFERPVTKALQNLYSKRFGRQTGASESPGANADEGASFPLTAAPLKFG